MPRIEDTALDLTAVAHMVTMAATINGNRQGMVSESVRDVWEVLTGLEGDAATELAQEITHRSGQTVGYAVPL